jgi:hypothetical protein
MTYQCPFNIQRVTISSICICYAWNWMLLRLAGSGSETFANIICSPSHFIIGQQLRIRITVRSTHTESCHESCFETAPCDKTRGKAVVTARKKNWFWISSRSIHLWLEEFAQDFWRGCAESARGPRQKHTHDNQLNFHDLRLCSYCV